MVRGGVALFCLRIIARFATTIKFVNEMVIWQLWWWSFRQQMERDSTLIASEATIGDLVFGAGAKTRALRHLSDENKYNAEYSSQPESAGCIGTRESQDAKLGYTQFDQSGSDICRPAQPSPSSEARLEPKWLRSIDHIILV